MKTSHRILPVPLFHADNNDYVYAQTPVNYSFGPADENEPIPSIIISIPIINDKDELNETFKLTLEVSAEDRAANVTEGPISTTVVLIKDDDGKLKQHYLQHNVTPFVPVLKKCTQWLQSDMRHDCAEIFFVITYITKHIVYIIIVLPCFSDHYHSTIFEAGFRLPHLGGEHS